MTPGTMPTARRLTPVAARSVALFVAALLVLGCGNTPRPKIPSLVADVAGVATAESPSGH